MSLGYIKTPAIRELRAQGGTLYTANKTINFLKPYTSTNYTLVSVGLKIDGVGQQLISKTTNGFTTTSNQRESGTESWYACGY